MSFPIEELSPDSYEELSSFRYNVPGIRYRETDFLNMKKLDDYIAVDNKIEKTLTADTEDVKPPILNIPNDQQLKDMDLLDGFDPDINWIELSVSKLDCFLDAIKKRAIDPFKRDFVSMRGVLKTIMLTGYSNEDWRIGACKFKNTIFLTSYRERHANGDYSTANEAGYRLIKFSRCMVLGDHDQSEDIEPSNDNRNAIQKEDAEEKNSEENPTENKGAEEKDSEENPTQNKGAEENDSEENPTQNEGAEENDSEENPTQNEGAEENDSEENPTQNEGAEEKDSKKNRIKKEVPEEKDSAKKNRIERYYMGIIESTLRSKSRPNFNLLYAAELDALKDSECDDTLLKNYVRLKLGKHNTTDKQSYKIERYILPKSYIISLLSGSGDILFGYHENWKIQNFKNIPTASIPSICERYHKDIFALDVKPTDYLYEFLTFVKRTMKGETNPNRIYLFEYSNRIVKAFRIYEDFIETSILPQWFIDEYED